VRYPGACDVVADEGASEPQIAEDCEHSAVVDD
jgi:hypothetical protein